MDIDVMAVGFLQEYVEQGMMGLAGQWSGRELGTLLVALPIPDSLAYVVLVNGERRPRSYRLEKGDVVKVVPLLVGG